MTKPFTIDLTSRVPRLSWLNAKTRKQSDYGRKNRSGHLPEHTEAVVENGSRRFATEVEKAFKASVEKNHELLEKLTDTPIPDVTEAGL
jgi:hypothetical protein